MPSALEEVKSLKKLGKTDGEISTILQEKGLSVTEVNDALNQYQIKKEVVSPEGMEPSIMEDTPAGEAPLAPPVPISKKKSILQKTAPVIQQQTMEYQYAPTQQQSPAPYEYTNYQYSQPAPASQNADIETIEEISEEVVNEKMSEFRGKIDELTEFKHNIQLKLSDLDDRLKRIEVSIDRLEGALITKVQEYNQNVKDLGTEMRTVEGAFSQILNPLVDNIKELSKITDKMKQKDKSK
jgi:DNA repair exonuclease SbcCD ATPase subunit